MVFGQKPFSIVLLLLVLRFPLFFEKLSFDYIFQFGDSINDTGNLELDGANNIGCGRFPYGISLHNSGSSRCSDGLLIIDYFAKFLNLSISPYLEKGGDFSQGVNFAVAGATALDVSILREKDIPSPFTNKSLSVQLNWFKSHLSSMCDQILGSECKQKLKKALIFMGEIGGNDYNFALLSRKPMEELYKLVPDVIQAIQIAMDDLINLGAVTIVVPGNFPTGCIPVSLASFGTDDPTMYDDLNCLKSLNDFTIYHNDLLQVAIKELQQKYSHVTIVYADYFSALRWIIENASILGFDKDEIQKACCGFGNNKYNFNGSHFCGDEGVPTCADPSKHISWDGLHFTQHAYQHMAHWLLQHVIPNIIVPEKISVLPL